MLYRIFALIFFFLSFLSGFVDLMGSLRSQAQFTQGRNSQCGPCESSDVDLHQVERTQQTAESGTVEMVTLGVYFYVVPPGCVSRGDRTVAPVEQIS